MWSAHDEMVWRYTNDGVKRGMAKAILMMLRARRLPHTPSHRVRAESRTRFRETSRWLARAAAARSVDEVLEARRWRHDYQSDFALKYVREGEARGVASVIVLLLEARGITCADEDAKRILGCSDVKQLTAWLRRAAHANSIEEVLG
jgi:hypothetical protein